MYFYSYFCILFLRLFIGLKISLGHTEQSLGKHKNGWVKKKIGWVLGSLNFHWFGGNNPVGRVSVGVLQRGVTYMSVLVWTFFSKPYVPMGNNKKPAKLRSDLF